jgi:hypothetical protein
MDGKNRVMAAVQSRAVAQHALRQRLLAVARQLVQHHPVHHQAGRPAPLALRLEVGRPGAKLGTP